MTVREMLEQREEEMLSPYAMLSCDSAGRDREEPPCDLRPVFQRDRDRILHCKSFRRLKHKTQVFLDPLGDHYRTRLTHTLEVSQIARTIAKALCLNEDLVEAIALGHDIGHTPFGHAGERALASVCPDGFAHNIQSVRVVEVLEKKGKGLNLTVEVRDGIRNHKTDGHPKTLEGKIVRLSDKIAYIHHDADDAIRGHILTEDDIPGEIRQTLGFTAKERLNTIVHDIIRQSTGQPDIRMSEGIREAVIDLRAFMFQSVYRNPRAKSEEGKAEKVVRELYGYYLEHIDKMPPEYHPLVERDGRERVVCDYIAGMTDSYAVGQFKEIYIPKSWGV